MNVSLSQQDELKFAYLKKEGIRSRSERPPPCGRPTRTGRECPMPRLMEPSWPYICVEYADYVVPGCAKHVTRSERAEHDRICAMTADRLEVNRRAYMASIRVECHGWSVTGAHRERAAAVTACASEDERFDLAVRLLADWQRGQCAICGDESSSLDHDHRTTWIRGYLCQGCNTSEGFGHREPESVFTRYRNRNPASILGIQVRYYGAFTGWAEPTPPPLTTDELAELWASIDLPPLNA